MSDKEKLIDAKRMMNEASPLAALRIIELAEGADDIKVRLSAAQFVYEQGLGKAAQSIDLKSEISYTLDPKQIAALSDKIDARLLQLGYVESNT